MWLYPSLYFIDLNLTVVSWMTERHILLSTKLFITEKLLNAYCTYE